MTSINKEEILKSATNSSLTKINLKSAGELSEFDENLIDTIREPLIALDKDLRIVKANHSFYDFFKVSPDEIIGKLIYDLGNYQWNIPKLRELLETILPEKTTFDNYEAEHEFTTIGKRCLLLNAREIHRGSGKEKIILLSFDDITQRKFADKLAKESNRMTSEYLDNLFNYANVPIIVWDSSLVILRFNHAFEKLSGYDWDELRDKKVDILLPEGKNDSSFELFKKTLINENLDVTEIDILTKDEERRTVLWNSASIFDKERKNIIATIAQGQDITLRKRTLEALRDSESKLEVILESTAYGILAMNKNGEVIKANKRFAELLLIPKTILDNLNENNLFNFVKEQLTDPEEFLAKMSLPYQSTDEFIDILNFKDGRVFERYTGPLLKEDSAIGRVWSFRDITQRKRVEKELIDAKEKAESANELKDAFIDNISHEIRTSLTGIVGMSSLIRGIFPGKIMKEDEELFEGIDFSSKRIIRTVDMILNYSRLQVGEFPVNQKSLELSSICEKLINEFTPASKNKSLNLKFNNNCEKSEIYADEYSITMSISNLIDNAIKFTDKGFINVNLKKGISDEIILEVKDTGIGISKEYLDKIFEPYRQEQMGYGRTFEGVGLGLAIVKKILNLNKCLINVKSIKGEGTTFTINFGKGGQPLKTKIEAGTVTDIPGVQEELRKEVVLIVEDEVINQKTIKRFIEKMYFAIITDSSDEAFEILKNNKVDLILMDISIKGNKNGLELTKDLKESKEFSHIPVIAVTAHAFLEDRQKALAAGCDDYLAKPFSKVSLLNMMASYVKK